MADIANLTITPKTARVAVNESLTFAVAAAGELLLQNGTAFTWQNLVNCTVEAGNVLRDTGAAGPGATAGAVWADTGGAVPAARCAACAGSAGGGAARVFCSTLKEITAPSRPAPMRVVVISEVLFFRFSVCLRCCR